MNKELKQHVVSVRKVLVEQFPSQCKEGTVNPSEWSDMQLAADWLSKNTFSLTKREVKDFNDLLLWVQSTVNEMLNWMRDQIESQRNDDAVTNELHSRFEYLWEEYDNRARALLELQDNKQIMKKSSQEFIVPQMKMDRPINIFFSYAHEDEALMDEVRIQLIVHERIGGIVKWHDRMIPPGDKWRENIDNRIEEAQVILLFMSPDFLASRYCYEVEGEIALRRNTEDSARVIPIVLRACDWTATPFGELQALPKDGIPFTQWPDRDQASLDIAQGIMSTIS